MEKITEDMLQLVNMLRMAVELSDDAYRKAKEESCRRAREEADWASPEFVERFFCIADIQRREKKSDGRHEEF